MPVYYTPNIPKHIKPTPDIQFIIDRQTDRQTYIHTYIQIDRQRDEYNKMRNK